MTGFRSVRPRESYFSSVRFLGALLICTAFLFLNAAQATPHMGFVHLKTTSSEYSSDSPPASAGLFAESARLHLQSRGIETVVALTSPDDAEQTLTAIAKQHVEILVVSDPILFEAACSVALAFPDTLFFVRTDVPVPDFMSGYQARTYEAYYLAGVQTAERLRTPSPELRFFAPNAGSASTTAEMYRNRNAFALGVRSILPDARIVLTRATDAVSLEERVRQTVDLNWRNVFASLLAQRRFGIWQAGRTLWYGMDSGVIRIASDADRDTRTATPKTIFSGPLYDDSDQLRVPRGKTLSDAELATLNWYVMGLIDENLP